MLSDGVCMLSDGVCMLSDGVCMLPDGVCMLSDGVCMQAMQEATAEERRLLLQEGEAPSLIHECVYVCM